MTNAIAVQPYVIIDRAIENQVQKTTVHWQELYLYETKIVSKHQHFALEHVYDMSYKIVSEDKGFLYLHTNAGVYSFIVRSSPSLFIESFRQLKMIDP